MITFVIKKKKALYLSVNVFSTKVLIGDTYILRLQLETGPPFYVVIRAIPVKARERVSGNRLLAQGHPTRI